MKNFFKAFGFMMMVFAFYLLVNIVLGIGFGIIVSIQYAADISAIQGDFAGVNDIILNGMQPFMLPLIIISNLITIGFVILIFLARKDQFMTYVGFRKVKVLDMLMIMVLGVFMNMLVVGLLTYAMNILPQPLIDSYSEVISNLFNGPLIMVILTGSIMAPLFEEILVRGVFLNDFKKALPVWLAVVIQAIAFGVMHWNIVQGTYAFILGIIFGVIYLKYRSIWMPILIHFTFNTTSLLMDSIFVDTESMDFINRIMVIGAVGCVIMTVLLVKNYKKEDYAAPVVDGYEDEVITESI